MKFINYLKSITGIEIYPLISLCIFVLFFTVVTIYVITARKQSMDECASLPLDAA